MVSHIDGISAGQMPMSSHGLGKSLSSANFRAIGAKFETARNAPPPPQLPTNKGPPVTAAETAGTVKR